MSVKPVSNQFKTTFYPPAIMECRLCRTTSVPVIPALLLGGLFLGWTNLRPNFGWFCTERGRTSGKFVFLVFSDKDSFVSKGKNVSNGEIIKGPNFFLRGQIFPANWPEKSAKSWQHWLCTGDSLESE